MMVSIGYRHYPGYFSNTMINQEKWYFTLTIALWQRKKYFWPTFHPGSSILRHPGFFNHIDEMYVKISQLMNAQYQKTQERHNRQVKEHHGYTIGDRVLLNKPSQVG